MREIELKFKVEDYSKLINNLQTLGCEIGDTIYQNDTIYVSNLNNIESNEGSIWLRVREENDRVELNLKKQSAIMQESKEIEFEVNSYEKANQFLETLGYSKWVVVNKKRRYAKYSNYNLCIDEVEHLGNFIEIEMVVKESDTKDYINDLLEVASILGLDKQNIVNSHYDTMISLLDSMEKMI